MESEDELKEIDIKNHTCYRFDDLMKANDIYSKNILLDENHCLFVSIEYMDLLKFMMELGI